MFLFDTATGRRVYRSLGERLHAHRRWLLWRAVEMLGVAVVAVAASLWLVPLGLAVGGLYLIWLAASD